MSTNWRAEIPQLLIILGMFFAAVVVWPFAPESFPVHWNIHGEVDRFGGRFEGLFLIPLIAAGMYALLLVLPRFDPGRANYESFRSAYLTIRLSILFLMAVIYCAMLLSAFKYPIDMGLFVAIPVGLLFMVLGNVMGKIRPNWFVGVRTPWTLSSRRSWNKTHRLAGWLFIAMGLAIGATGIVQKLWMLAIAGVVFVVSLIWMVIYSYIIWRNDPERLTPGSISPSDDAQEMAGPSPDGGMRRL